MNGGSTWKKTRVFQTGNEHSIRRNSCECLADWLVCLLATVHRARALGVNGVGGAPRDNRGANENGQQLRKAVDYGVSRVN